jgi:predicted naringenin-chalcone synthase
MPVTIAGIATAVPSQRILQSDAAEIAKQYSCETAAQERLFLGMYRRSGVEARHSVVLDRSDGALAGRQSFYTRANPTTSDRMRKYAEGSGGLAVAAGGAALRDAGLAPDRVTHVVTVSCSGFHAPGFDLALIKQLGLPAGVARTHVGFMGCHGLLNGLRVARAFVAADPSAATYVLLCAVELCSLHHQYGWDSEQIVANALFADGAAAMVVQTVETRCAGPYQLSAAGSTLIEDSEDAMSWRIGNNGFTMTLSPRVPDLIGRHVRPWLVDWLARHGQAIDTVGSWAVHPGGPRILSAFGEAAGLDRTALETSYRVLAEFGNMSSPTVAFILDRLRADGAPRPCVALAFGPGLAVEAALLQ